MILWCGFFSLVQWLPSRVLLSRHAGANLTGWIRLLSIRTYIAPIHQPSELLIFDNSCFFRVLLLLFSSLLSLPSTQASNAYIWSEIHITIKSPSQYHRMYGFWAPRGENVPHHASMYIVADVWERLLLLSIFHYSLLSQMPRLYIPVVYFHNLLTQNAKHPMPQFSAILVEIYN